MTILDHLWQSTLVAGLIALLALIFRNNSAGVRYWLWFAASLKFLLPFSLLAEIGRPVLPAGDRAVADERTEKKREEREPDQFESHHNEFLRCHIHLRLFVA